MNRRNFTAMIKPASSLCNMRCRYCFYCDEAALRRDPPAIMEREIARAVIARAYEAAAPGAQVHFVFQGGEPTLAGPDFFRQFVEDARAMNEKQARLSFSIQTNGLLIDETWAAFLAENRFLVGLSVDAEAKWHDLNRVDGAGQGTFSRVMRAKKLLEKAGADVNLLCVVTEGMAKHPQAVFRAFEKAGAKYIQLIPCLCGLDGVRRPHDLSGEKYAAFMEAFFHLWADSAEKGGQMHVRSFDNLISLARGMGCEQCGADGTCAPQFIVEANGDIYPCDFFALDLFCAGNVLTESAQDALESEGMRRFLTDFIPKGTLCGDCPVFPLCGGGCRRYRPFYQEKDGFCPQREFLMKIAPRLIRLAAGRR